MAPPIRLSVGASTGQKVFSVIFSLIFLGIFATAGVVAATVIGFGDFFGDSGISEFDGMRPVFAGIFGVVGLLVLAGFVNAMLTTFRTRADLDGSVLSVRGALTTRRVDLARARVWVDSVAEYARDPHHDHMAPTGRRIPRLIAAELPSGPVRLRLRAQRGSFLPPHELQALADAIDSGGRPDPAAAQATQTSTLLRRLATDPLPRLL
jgi:hypothetical protein